MLRRVKLFVLIVLFSACLNACSQPVQQNPTPTIFVLPTPPEPTGTPVVTVQTILANDQRLSTLNELVELAGVGTQLAASEQLTLFAPTNEAFEALPVGILDELRAAPGEDLTDLLFYHASRTTLTSTDIEFSAEIPTLLAQPIIVRENADGQILVGGAMLVQTDIPVSNGTIHIIDAVLVPPSLSFETTLAGLVASKNNLSTLTSALELANLTETLDADIDYTVLAPTDSAFDALPEALLDRLDDNPLELAEVLSYHVIPGKLTAEELNSLNLLQTIQGQTVLVYNRDGAPVINGSINVIESDLEGSNGIVHVIDGVLLPADLSTDEDLPSVAEIASERPELSTMLAAILAAGLGDEFQAPGQFTLFAPTNAAFDNLPPGALDDLLANPDELRKLVLYHTIYGDYSSAEVSQTPVLPMITGQVVNAEADDISNRIFLNDLARVNVTDIQARNGVIHEIDEVLIRPSESTSPSIAAIVAQDERLTTLNTALETADMETTLSGPGSFTLFAPTNDAFDAMPAGNLDALSANPDQLRRVLLYHVLNGARDIDTAASERLIATLQGSPVLIFEQGGSLTANGAPFRVTDIEASNGTIHLIDAVILPPNPVNTGGTESIMELIEENPNLTTFARSLKDAELDTLMAGAGPYTVFAPTDAAFDTLPVDVRQELQTDPDLLRRTLLNHITLGAFDGVRVLSFDDILMVSGQRHVVNDSAEAIGGAPISATDIRASNGFAHVIDRVLVLPDEGE